MWVEKRTGKNSVPENLGEFLNKARLLALSKAEGFGWELEFVRRPLFQEVVPVLRHPDSGNYGTLEDDGTLNTQSDIKIR
ncbi:MAG: hypothetical protein ABFS45_14925 [Pseudomonadota bacterium]